MRIGCLNLHPKFSPSDSERVNNTEDEAAPQAIAFSGQSLKVLPSQFSKLRSVLAYFRFN